jgi:spore coat polysaccharide biosynthesis protein SpsF (cytidylyltransferase family)|tara:strand:+ start:200 stop:859 length:660 start_codon:yes stop_codon:yes gene_type:complete
MGSTRLPGKVLKDINGKPLIEILLHRLSLSKKIDKIILATSKNSEDNLLTEIVQQLGFDVYRGSEHDVLDRYYQASIKYNPKVIIRVTGDCPIIDPKLVDSVIYKFLISNVNYASNTMPRTFPDGLDLSVFSFSTLKLTWIKAKSDYDREHVTSFMRTDNQFSRINVSNPKDYSKERWTVDEKEDLSVITEIIDYFSPNLDFSWRDVIKYNNSILTMHK